MQISNENSFREGFRRQGSQEGFPEGGFTGRVSRGRASREMSNQRVSKVSNQVSGLPRASQCAFPLRASQEQSKWQSTYLIDSVWGGFSERVAGERVSRTEFTEEWFPGLVFRGREGLGLPNRRACIQRVQPSATYSGVSLLRHQRASVRDRKFPKVEGRGPKVWGHVCHQTVLICRVWCHVCHQTL